MRRGERGETAASARIAQQPAARRHLLVNLARLFAAEYFAGKGEDCAILYVGVSLSAIKSKHMMP